MSHNPITHIARLNHDFSRQLYTVPYEDNSYSALYNANATLTWVAPRDWHELLWLGHCGLRDVYMDIVYPNVCDPWNGRRKRPHCIWKTASGIREFAPIKKSREIPSWSTFDRISCSRARFRKGIRNAPCIPTSRLEKKVPCS